jgi:hypothetical protein
MTSDLACRCDLRWKRIKWKNRIKSHDPRHSETFNHTLVLFCRVSCRSKCERCQRQRQWTSAYPIPACPFAFLLSLAAHLFRYRRRGNRRDNIDINEATIILISTLDNIRLQYVRWPAQHCTVHAGLLKSIIV